MPQKLSYEYVKNKIEEIGYELISTDYVNSKTKLNIICPKGHSFYMRFNAFHNGDRCGFCANRISITLDVIKKLCNKHNLFFVFTKEIKYNSDVIVKCENNHEFTTTYSSMRLNNIKCNICFYRTCRRCDIYKNLEDMEKRNDSPSGRGTLCKGCANTEKREYSKTEEGKQKRRKYAINYTNKNRENVNKYAREWRCKNKERLNPKQKEYRDKNLQFYRQKDREKFQNPKRKLQHKINQADRRARKLRATPLWLTEEQKQEITNIYTNCPIGYHVDHIEPLRGKEICGLHVPWNMQYLPALENIRNGNRRKKIKY